MRRRQYYVMPDHASARKIMDDLLLARIEERHIHCLARPGTSMEGLHEANVLQKSDLVHGAQVGLLLGALLGCIVGGAVVWVISFRVMFLNVGLPGSPEKQLTSSE